MDELESFFRTILHTQTNFTIRRVYQYDTFPGHALLAKHDGNFYEDWMKPFDERFEMFKKSLELALRYNNLLDNKIGVVIDFQVPGYRDGLVGTLLWCHKDWKDGFYLSCNPNKYVKNDLEITFHL